jgi:dephospho-CoA kinase
MLRVGLTGGLGSGKSTVAALFRSLGVHVIEADAIGRALMQPGEKVYDAILTHFGKEILLPADAAGHHPLNRAALAKLVFDNGRIEELNAIVHPAVIAAQEKWMSEIAATEPDAIAMVESALIFETKHGSAGAPAAVEGDSEDREIAAAISTTGWQTRFDRILLVTAREDLKIARYIQRASETMAGRTLTASERTALQDDAKRRLAAQIADEVKSPLCDYVIENNGDPAALQISVNRIFAALRSSAAALARRQ